MGSYKPSSLHPSQSQRNVQSRGTQARQAVQVQWQPTVSGYQTTVKGNTASASHQEVKSGGQGYFSKVCSQAQVKNVRQKPWFVTTAEDMFVISLFLSQIFIPLCWTARLPAGSQATPDDWSLQGTSSCKQWSVKIGSDTEHFFK